MKKFLALSLSYVVFIMLINVKMPTIYELDKIRAQLFEHEKSFIASGPEVHFVLKCPLRYPV